MTPTETEFQNGHRVKSTAANTTRKIEQPEVFKHLSGQSGAVYSQFLRIQQNMDPSLPDQLYEIIAAWNKFVDALQSQYPKIDFSKYRVSTSCPTNQ
jgi:hypothetical protein